MDSIVKKETVEAELPVHPATGPAPPHPLLSVIDISSSDGSSEDEEGPCMAPHKKLGFLDGGVASGGPLTKGKWKDKAGVVLPVGFLDPLPMEEAGQPPLPLSTPQPISVAPPLVPVVKGCRQFWKAGDYDGDAVVEPKCLSAGIDHVRVHPKFLHSNATSHKWALGAVAELLDNAVDEVCNGATFVNVDVLENRKNMTKMLLVEDNGGGMDPTKLRQCMSLGYSVKSKSTNMIGQYGNGFKTSTMRLGADVIVFSRCRGKGGKSSTQSIGLLSYMFLRDTGKEDIIVPMLDYEKREENWNRLVRSSSVDWNKNLETILQWSPYLSEEDLLQQFATIEDQGTRIVIYNLWDDDQGELELEFNADAYDIQVRGASRDEKKIQMAKKFPNSKHFLTYRHSLRSYASILYLRLPQDFKMILRGREIEHHNIANDMMIKQEHTYKPHYACDGVPRDPNMVAVVTVGFVKDAKEHIDVQGFNVYHKNRLIKPFWRVWNASGSGGRGVIGVLEANFVEPAHDKQDFERTTVLARLEARLAHMQKAYWAKNSYLVGYCERTMYKKSTNGHNEASSPSLSKAAVKPVEFTRTKNGRCENGLINASKENGINSAKGFEERSKVYKRPHSGNGSDASDHVADGQNWNASSDSRSSDSSAKRGRMASVSHLKETVTTCEGSEQKSPSSDMMSCELQRENLELKDRLKKMEDQKKSLIEKLEETEKLLEESHKEQEALVDIFSEERDRRDMEEDNLRKKLKDACATIEQLRDKLTCTTTNVKA